MASQGLITVTVTPNHPPQAVADKVSVVAGGAVAINPVANDRDPDKDPLRLVSATSANPAAGSAAVASGNRLVIKAAARFTGRLHGARTWSPTGWVAGLRVRCCVTVTPPPAKPKPVNRAPVARADEATVLAGSRTRIKVLANDSDPDGDRIKLVSVGKASMGQGQAQGQEDPLHRAEHTGQGDHHATRSATSTAPEPSAVLTVTVKARPVSKNPSRAKVEAALKRLRLPVGAANGNYDGATRRAVCSWRTITGRTAHRGLPSASEARAIVAMHRLPRARSTMATGVTVSITCQSAFWVGKARTYKRVMAACSGKSGYRTRLGSFRVFRSFTTWRWSTIYPEARMYKPMQFSGGQALHGSSTDRLVKTYPASHGCVRMFHRDIDAMHRGGLGLGTKVKVIGHWKG